MGSGFIMGRSPQPEWLGGSFLPSGWTGGRAATSSHESGHPSQPARGGRPSATASLPRRGRPRGSAGPRRSRGRARPRPSARPPPPRRRGPGLLLVPHAVLDAVPLALVVEPALFRQAGLFLLQL